MNLAVVKEVSTKAVMKLRKISPELALAGGITCAVAAVVVGCLASRHVDEVVNEVNAELDDIQGAIENGQVENPKKELFKAYIRGCWKFIKLYGMTFTLLMLAIGLILASRGILQKRYLAISSAYSALDAAFKDYRRRVVDAIGEERERIIFTDSHTEKNIKFENDNGEIETKKTNSLVSNDHAMSPYEFNFNRFTSTEWQPNAEYNEMILRNAERFANLKFNTQGHLFLNEVLDALGMDRTPAGAVCGWIKGAGDNDIDFGYWENFKKDYATDSDLCVKNIHLNFNCDGPIWELI